VKLEVTNEIERKQILNEKDITLEELSNKIFFNETRISVLTNVLAEKIQFFKEFKFNLMIFLF
jgi:DNA-binding Xre family transcriptional regulator